MAGVFARPAVAQIDPTGKWRTLETDHFRIHARAELHDVALRAAGEAELAWSELSAALPAPHGRVDLIVADNVDDANGYAQTYPGNRVTIYAMPPAGDIELLRYDRWLRLVITHELAHIFHLDLARGWWGVGRKVLGRAPFLFPNQYTPAWMREGLAVFYESRLTSAGRLDGAYHSAITSAESREGGGLPLDAATTPSPIWPSGERFYAFGSTFIGHAAELHGDSSVAHAVSATSAQLIPYVAISPGWRAGTGVRLGPAWEEWQDALDSATAGDSSAAAMDQLGELRLSVPPRLSRDGSQLLLAYNDGRDASRLVILPTDSAVRRLPSAVYRLSSPSGVAWTPDGNALVAQLEFQDLYNTRSDLWSVTPEGSATRLTNGERLREPDMAPDSAIVAVRLVPGGRELVLRLPGEDWQVIGAASNQVEWATPRFDRSGRFIAAVRVESGWHDIQAYSRAAGTWRAVTRDSVADIQPAFSTDGRWLTWSREMDGVPQIVGVPAAGDSAAPLTQFTHEPFAAYAPAVSADRLWYMAYHYDGFRLASRPLGGVPAGPAPLQPQRTLAAPQTAIHGEHGYHALQTLLPQYWIPQLYLEPSGAWIGALTSGTDAISRHSYFVSLLVGSGSVGGVWNGVLAYRYAGPGKLLFDAFGSHAPGLFGNGTCCAVNDDAGAGLTWTRRRWYVSSAVRLGGEYSRDENAERVGGSVSASIASFVTPALGISPQDGGRVSASVRYRRRQDDGRSSVEYLLRGTAYIAEGRSDFAKAVFAVRAVGGLSTGSDSTDFSVGGVSSGTFDVLPGLTVGGGGRTFAVRGFEGGSLSGRGALALSVEQRLPLLLVGRGLGLFPLGLDRMSLSLFADAGTAVNQVGYYCPGDLLPPGPPAPVTGPCGVLLSAGAEVSLDLEVAYDVPLRVRVGVAGPISRPDGVRTAPFYLSIGAAF